MQRDGEERKFAVSVRSFRKLPKADSCALKMITASGKGTTSKLRGSLADKKAGQLISVVVRDDGERDTQNISDGLGVRMRKHLVLFKNI